jgi:S-adenosylmethionine-diacylglycerol 3-amino-3-carboxypropyl transferase
VGIMFSRAWEDDRLDTSALAVSPGQKVLVVAGAGDAALALAACGAQVFGVDRNPDQLRLVALKIAAVRVLSSDHLYRWFEQGKDPEAIDLYRRLVRPELEPADASWWDDRISIFTRGLHDHAGVGRSFGRLGVLARLIVPGLARGIESFPDTSTQLVFWRTRVRPRLFGRVTHLLAARTPLLASLTPDSRELAKIRAGGWSHGLVARIDDVVSRHLIREHPWWRPALSGRAADPGFGAAWLDPAHVRALASGSGSIRLHAGDLTSTLTDMEPGSLDAISVSNVPDWLGDADEHALARAVRRALAPGGRLLVRRVVSAPPDRDAFSRLGLLRDVAGKSLVKEDRTALYETVDMLRAT